MTGLQLRQFLHVGFPKCASSTLQRYLFLNHPDLRMFGKVCFSEMGGNESNIRYDHHEINDKFYNAIVPVLDRADAVMEDHYKENILNSKKLLSKIIATYKDTFVFSWEGLVSNSIYPSRRIRAERLRQIFDNPKIIFVIRNQPDALRSLYDHVPNDPLKSPEARLYERETTRKKTFYQKTISLEEWLDKSMRFPHRSPINQYRYYEIIKLYEDIFGKENIGIFLFEDFVNDKENFSKKISAFMDIDWKTTYQLLSSKRAHSNKPNSKLFQNLAYLNDKYLHISPSVFLPKSVHSRLLTFLGYQSGKKTVFSKDQKTKISLLYASANKKLMERYSLPLDKYEYPGC